MFRHAGDSIWKRQGYPRLGAHVESGPPWRAAGDNDVRSSPAFLSWSPSGADQAVSRTDVLHDDATSLPAICQSVADEILLTYSRLTPVSSDGLAGC